ncbi:Neuropeptide-Like Protein [Caenorhabditis elegans]|uniref:Neuropeptide-Like Protein n=1 Tax=Caenorhabditis elegans TaxID=6239 RepID=G5EF24_CAEEL|nr:Neuropeptide-Like Protein [Caenorhabditis elegans]CAE17800.1 Neuropeptide-Like Protein [Caenorhabditis elegans]|eukprot:NP_001024601.1 Uncharacterized protein CELE_F23D12.7 [Caenorhabditis elegans]
MFRFLLSFLTLFMVLLVGISLSAPIPNIDNAEDFRYPQDPEDFNNMPMATARPSVNPCN